MTKTFADLDLQQANGEAGPQFKFLTPSHINVTEFTKGTFLFHGNYASGKSYLAGDACRYYHNLGKRFVYLNVGGEDGQTSAMRDEFAGLDYQAFLDVPNSYAALDECAIAPRQLNAHVAVVDSLTQVYRITEHHTTGGDAPPQSRGYGDNEWMNIHLDFDKIMMKLKTMTEIVILLCPSDLGSDPIVSKEKGVTEREQTKAANRMVVPDLPGKLASRVLTYCDIAGYIKTDYKESNSTMQRRVCFTNPNKYKVRQRLPKEITHDILLPQGHGGWEKILTEIQNSYGAKL